MPSEKDKILKFIQYVRSNKISYIINTDIESLIKKRDGCANNPENFSKTKICEHIHCRYSMWAVLGLEDKHTLYRRKECMKKFCTSFREHVKNIIDFEKKNMLPLTKKEVKSY